MEEGEKSSKNDTYKGAAFLTAVTGLSLLGGFGLTLTMAKRHDPEGFSSGVVAATKNTESGGSLAMRALGRASLYSVGSFALFCVVVWKASGVNSFAEFRQKMGGALPRLSPTSPPQSRTEFGSIRQLFDYLVEEDERKKSEKCDT